MTTAPTATHPQATAQPIRGTPVSLALWTASEVFTILGVRVSGKDEKRSRTPYIRLCQQLQFARTSEA
eukprot:1954502-Pyramimonas_sp.AAC.1